MLGRIRARLRGAAPVHRRRVARASLAALPSARRAGGDAPPPARSTEYEKALRSCLHEVEWLSGLTNRLLTLARSGRGRITRVSAPVGSSDPDPRSRRSPGLAPEASRRDVAVLVDAPGRPDDQGRAECGSLVVGNVLDNAVKFSPPGSRIRIQVTPEGGHGRRRHFGFRPGHPGERAAAPVRAVLSGQHRARR